MDDGDRRDQWRASGAGWMTSPSRAWPRSGRGGAILQFWRDWRGVGEVSAVLRLPLGVARILIADMSADGLVRIHQRDDSEGRPDLNLLERVFSGLGKI